MRRITLLVWLPLLVAWSMPLPPTEQPIGDWLKASEFKEEKGSAKAWKVDQNGLVLLQHDDSTTVGTARGLPLSVTDKTTIKLEVKVDALATKGDLARAKTEDAAFRLFIMFDKGGGLMSPPHTIGYAITAGGKAGDVVTSERFDDVRFKTIAAGAEATGKWLAFSLPVAADYKALFKTDQVPAIKALALKADTNDTGGKSSATLRVLKIE